MSTTIVRSLESKHCGGKEGERDHKLHSVFPSHISPPKLGSLFFFDILYPATNDL